jgi:hypothetical protein
MKKSVMLIKLLLVALAMLPLSANATFTTFFGEDLGGGEGVRLPAHPNADAARDDFIFALSGVGTEDFEVGHSTGATAPLVVTFPGSSGAITATILGSGAISTVPSGTNGVGRYPISGNNYWEGTESFSITFSKDIAAFGFYGVDIGDFDGNLTVTYVDGATTTLTVPNSTNIAGGSVLYYGFIDSDHLFNELTFGNTAAGVDFFAFDDFTIGDIGQVVPEPTTLWLLSIGLLGLCAKRRYVI